MFRTWIDKAISCTRHFRVLPRSRPISFLYTFWFGRRSVLIKLESNKCRKNTNSNLAAERVRDIITRPRLLYGTDRRTTPTALCMPRVGTSRELFPFGFGRGNRSTVGFGLDASWRQRTNRKYRRETKWKHPFSTQYETVIAIGVT